MLKIGDELMEEREHVLPSSSSPGYFSHQFPRFENPERCAVEHARSACLWNHESSQNHLYAGEIVDSDLDNYSKKSYLPAGLLDSMHKAYTLQSPYGNWNRDNYGAEVLLSEKSGQSIYLPKINIESVLASVTTEALTQAANTYTSVESEIEKHVASEMERNSQRRIANEVETQMELQNIKIKDEIPADCRSSSSADGARLAAQKGIAAITVTTRTNQKRREKPKTRVSSQLPKQFRAKWYIARSRFGNTQHHSNKNHCKQKMLRTAGPNAVMSNFSTDHRRRIRNNEASKRSRAEKKSRFRQIELTIQRLQRQNANWRKILGILNMATVEAEQILSHYFTF